MAFTQAQLDSIEAAIGSGSLEVHFKDRMVRYRSMPELIQARNTIRSGLGLNANCVRRVKIYSDKGFDGQNDYDTDITNQ